LPNGDGRRIVAPLAFWIARDVGPAPLLTIRDDTIFSFSRLAAMVRLLKTPKAEQA
jgi:hypothetical protein